MNNNVEKPSAEAKALSLFLMAFKSKSPVHKEKSKRINKLWKLVLNDELDSSYYVKEVKVILTSFGGYSKVVELTVKHYIDKTGAWTLKGDDKYCKDAQEVADSLMNK